ncbi:MAG: TIGR04255 family protein [Polyangia bacterium]
MGEDESQLLTIPEFGKVTCARDFIKTAVCELRIPTVLELENSPPRKFAKAVKHDYPVYNRGHGVAVNFGPGPATQAITHAFYDRKRRWIASFKSSALTLETSHYQGFDDFHTRVMRIVAASKEERDSDFFVRVGLRYINTLPVGQEDGLEGWINKDLATPLLEGTYGSVREFWQTVRGEATSGGYTLRHGLKEIAPPPPGAQRSPTNYVLDMDFYRENVEEAELDGLLWSLHDESFRLFAWAIGEKAREHMDWQEEEDGDHD